MNPIKFVEKAQSLVMQQIISNANFGVGPPKTSQKDSDRKRNKYDFLKSDIFQVLFLNLDLSKTKKK
jgi:hypothetical protein